MSELNPNHPMTCSIRDHWHKLCAAVVRKYAAGHAVITIDDMTVPPEGFNITCEEVNDAIHLRIVSDAEAISLARGHGGLPGERFN